MRRAAALLLVSAGLPLLSGCVAAVLPLAAVGAMARSERARATGDDVAQGEPTVEVLPDDAPPAMVPDTQAVAPAESQAHALTIDPMAPPPPGTPTGPAARDLATATGATVVSIDRRQGDAAMAAIRRDLPTYMASGRHAYADFFAFALHQADQREAGTLTDTVMLAAPPLPGDERFLPCGFLPPAVLIDLDDGRGDGLNLAAVDATSAVAATDGLADALAQLRLRDIAIIWLSAQPFDRLDAMAAALRSTGLDPDGRDQIVLTRTVSERKQERRSDAASSHCILAIAGDRKADFDEFYDYLRNPDTPMAIDRMIGAGWFLAPQPLMAAPMATAVSPTTPNP